MCYVEMCTVEIRWLEVAGYFDKSELPEVRMEFEFPVIHTY